jgi:hypothetical protein
MKARGWVRVQSAEPTKQQFRGPEDDEEFSAPPDPLSARGVASGGGRADDPACVGATASRPSQCR